MKNRDTSIMSSKLNERQIKWMIKELKKGKRTQEQISNIQDVTQGRISQLWNEYKQTGKIPKLKQAGRPKEPLSEKEKEAIKEAHDIFKVGANLLEDILQEEYGLKISHYKIHKYLKRIEMASENKKKQQRRKWVRWERDHSMSLWHTDYKWFADLDKWMIAYEDDASRMIMSYNLVDKETTENAIKTLDKAIGQWGKPREILTDQGTQFYASGGDKKEKGLSEFEEYLACQDIRQIVGRVSHPQTTGKIERLYRTLEEKLHLFDYDMDEAVKWYNEIKPHMSLRYREHYRTPRNTFFRKLPPEKLLQYSNEWFWK